MHAHLLAAIPNCWPWLDTMSPLILSAERAFPSWQQVRAGPDKRTLAPCLHYTVHCFGLMQVDTEIFDVLVKETGLTKQQLHDWAKTENELKQVCTPEEIAGTLLFRPDWQNSNAPH